jgi:hypothetical protein
MDAADRFMLIGLLLIALAIGAGIVAALAGF